MTLSRWVKEKIGSKKIVLLAISSMLILFVSLYWFAFTSEAFYTARDHALDSKEIREEFGEYKIVKTSLNMRYRVTREYDAASFCFYIDGKKKVGSSRIYVIKIAEHWTVERYKMGLRC